MAVAGVEVLLRQVAQVRRLLHQDRAVKVVTVVMGLFQPFLVRLFIMRVEAAVLVTTGQLHL